MKRIREWMKNHPVVYNLVSNLVACMIFLMFLQSPSQYIMVAIPKWLGKMGVTFVNVFFRQAALASSYSLLFTVFTVVFLSIAFLTAGNMIDIIKKLNGNIKRVNKLSKAIERKVKPSDIDDEVTQTNELNPKDELDKTYQEAKRLKLKAILLFVLLTICTICVFFYMIAPHVLKDTFDRTITMIRPYTSEATINELESEWVQMKTYSDYSEIDHYMEEIRAKNNIDE